jgi:hypothetical protein
MTSSVSSCVVLVNRCKIVQKRMRVVVCSGCYSQHGDYGDDTNGGDGVAIATKGGNVKSRLIWVRAKNMMRWCRCGCNRM